MQYIPSVFFFLFFENQFLVIIIIKYSLRIAVFIQFNRKLIVFDPFKRTEEKKIVIFYDLILSMV